MARGKSELSNAQRRDLANPAIRREILNRLPPSELGGIATYGASVGDGGLTADALGAAEEVQAAVDIAALDDEVLREVLRSKAEQ